jgi:hypothetical protein
MAKEVAKMTAQLVREFSQAREKLTQIRSELEPTRLQLHAMRQPKEPYRFGRRMRTSLDGPLLSAFLPRPPPQVGRRRRSRHSARWTSPGCRRNTPEKLHR